MRLHPFPPDRVSVGIDITTDAVRLVALNLARTHQSDQAGPVEIDLISTWTHPCDWQIDDLHQWVDKLCETLQHELPENTCPNRTRVSLSIPSPWLRHHTQPSQASLDAPDPPHRRSVSVDEDAVYQIASVLDRRGYRLDWVVPDGIAVGLTSPSVMGMSSPCVVMLHHDGGTITLFDHMTAVLVRSLPPVGRPDGATQSGPSPAQWQQWRETIAQEIDATLEYYGRLANDWKFADRITEQSPIVFAGSLFETLPDHGLNTVDLLSQWSGSLGRPLALWTSEIDSEHATAMSLAMIRHLDRKPCPPVRRTLEAANLLPARFGLTQRYETVRLRWAAGWIIGFMITVMFGVDRYIVQRGRYADQQHRQEVIEPIRHHVRQLQRVESECIEELERIQAVASYRPNDEALQALAAIAAAIPAGKVDLQHTELDFMTGHWLLTGIAPTQNAVHEMIDRLRQSRWVAAPPQHDESNSVIVTTKIAAGGAFMDARRDDRPSGSEFAYEFAYEADGRFRWNARLGGWNDSPSDGGDNE